ncbi:DUF2545 family protein [Salmonella enterica subsp. enterica]|nr:DUF2545 family protein [Salmonella enterica subsp. enterica]
MRLFSAVSSFTGMVILAALIYLLNVWLRMAMTSLADYCFFLAPACGLIIRFMVGYGGVSRTYPSYFKWLMCWLWITRPIHGPRLTGRRSPHSSLSMLTGTHSLPPLSNSNYFGYTRCQRIDSADNVGASVQEG